MSQISYRVNLTTGFLPMLVSLHGQTVIVPKQDQNVTPRDQILAGEGAADRDRGFPQAMYMHNVMPTNVGFKSVGYNTKIAGIGVTTFNDCFILKDINENKYLYSPVSGQHYVWDGSTQTWTPSNGTAIQSSTLVTVAYLNGNTYVFFQGTGCFQYDHPTRTLLPVALTGITATALNGICASNGYLIAWDNFTVYRSQPLSVLNFTPDPSQGSGSSIPNDIKGTIVACLPITDGFIVYCTKNAVAASFQNNIQYPFIFKEVKGSGGISAPSQVTWTANLGIHYAFTSVGLVSLNKLQATQVFPEVTDFLTARIYEYFDPVTNTLQIIKLTSPLSTKLALIADRYLVLSYGITALTDALVHDLGYKRWGKLHLNHVASFEYAAPTLSGGITWKGLGNLTWQDLGNTSWADLAAGVKTVDYANETVAFLQNDGTIVTMALDMVATNESGVLILGKYQFLRNYLLILDEIDIQNVTAGQFTVVDLPTLDGMNFLAAVTLFPDPENAGTIAHYYTETEALNHSICLEGTFDVCDMELTFHLGGHA